MTNKDTRNSDIIIDEFPKKADTDAKVKIGLSFSRGFDSRENFLSAGYAIPDSDSIRNAISKPGALPINKKEFLEKSPSNNSLQKYKILKEYCIFFTPNGPIPGFLSVGAYVVIFEPDLRCHEVQKQGFGPNQVIHVSACATVMLPGGPFLKRYLGFNVDFEHDISDYQSCPAYFQILMKTCPRICYETSLKSPSKPPTPKLKKPKDTNCKSSPLTDSPILLFWFAKYSVVKQFTLYVIELLDERSIIEPDYDDVKKIISKRNSENNKNQISKIPKYTLTSIPYTSNEIFEILLLSLQNQESLLLKAETNLMSQKKPIDLTQLIHESVILLPRIYNQSQSSDLGSSDNLDPCLSVMTPTLISSELAPVLVTEKVSQELASVIFPSLAIKTWRMTFCTKLDGISYQTFYRKISNCGPVILLVVDTLGSLFGAFCPNGIHESSRYYGTGETFVFTFNSPKSKKLTTTELETASKNWTKIQVYHWTNKNSFFLFTNSSMIAIGGGGNYALSIDSNFLYGLSQPCETFDNPCLAHNTDFIIHQFQVWSFD